MDASALALRPSAPAAAWSELVALVEDIRSPDRDDVLAAIEAAAGDRLAPSLAARIAEAVHRLYCEGPTRD